jgi:large subunit ribosomal protein L7/L12
MADLNYIVDQLSELTLPEAGQLAEMVAERWGVNIFLTQKSAPLTVNPVALEIPAVQKTEFDLVLLGCGPKKIEVIKEVRSITGLGLKEAKDFVESAGAGSPRTIKESLNEGEAKAFLKRLLDAGATAELQ